MRYALLIYGNLEELGSLTEADAHRLNAGFADVAARPDVSSVLRLKMPDQATTLRSGGGSVLATDGPFVDSKDFLGGIFFVEADSLDAARAVATEIQERGLAAGVEIRPVNEEELVRA